MTFEDQLQQASARCISIIRRYHNRENMDHSKNMMQSEIATIVGWLTEVNLPAGVATDGILVPVGKYLIMRYGPEVGRRLITDFVEAFEAVGMHLLSRQKLYSHLSREMLN